MQLRTARLYSASNKLREIIQEEFATFSKDADTANGQSAWRKTYRNLSSLLLEFGFVRLAIPTTGPNVPWPKMFILEMIIGKTLRYTKPYEIMDYEVFKQTNFEGMIFSLQSKCLPTGTIDKALRELREHDLLRQFRIKGVPSSFYAVNLGKILYIVNESWREMIKTKEDAKLKSMFVYKDMKKLITDIKKDNRVTLISKFIDGLHRSKDDVYYDSDVLLCKAETLCINIVKEIEYQKAVKENERKKKSQWLY